jgi:hypothetical protein
MIVTISQHALLVSVAKERHDAEIAADLANGRWKRTDGSYQTC